MHRPGAKGGRKVLSKFCRECKGNNAEYLWKLRLLLTKMWASLHKFLYLFLLTSGWKTVILESTGILFQESCMSDEKLALLRRSHTLHPHPDQVRDPLFTSGSPFFDPRDLVQVKYELLRRVRVDGYSVSLATSLFALSRPTFYAALAAWEQAGIAGLLPEPTGPRHAHKLTPEILAQLQPLARTMSSPQLAQWVQQHYQLIVHPRSIERALARKAQKGGPS
jgi:transposase